MSELVPANGRPTTELGIIPGEITPVGLKLPAGLELGEWINAGKLLSIMEDGVKWWRGDWINYGEDRADWGEMYTQALEESDMTYGGLRNEAYVARRVHLSRRRDKLTWSHHQEVAPFEPGLQDWWLSRAEEGDVEGAQGERRTWSRTRLREEIKKAALGEAVWPEGEYRVIYADPPWEYDNSGLDQYGPAARHYPTMSTEEMCALDGDAQRGFASRVRELAADEAVLFVWATSAMLPDALAVIEAWGFRYASSFVWDKVGHNYGRYNSVRHELLLVATKGSCQPDKKELYDSVVTVDKTSVHSQKPEIFRDMIDDLYRFGPRIELFLRGDAPEGWDGWGNEAAA